MVAAEGNRLGAREICIAAIEEGCDFVLEEAGEVGTSLDTRHIGYGSGHGICMFV